MFAEGFPGDEMKLTPNELVTLSETSKTLEILFQYMYRQPQPDLSEFPFEDVSAVAEASEKYFVFAAMEVCKIYMRHGYNKICNESAPRTIHSSLAQTLSALGGTTFIPWVLYREAWMKISTSTLQDPQTVVHRQDRQSSGGRGGSFAFGGSDIYGKIGPPTTPLCDMWPPFKMEVAVAVGSNPCTLLKINGIFSSKLQLLGDCTYCRTHADKWLKTLQSEVARVQPFSEFM